MSDWKLTVIGGAENGNDYSFPADKTVLVGRTHQADLRLSEPDVSGRHVELFTEDGVAMVRNLSRQTLRLNSSEYATGQTASVSAGDTLHLGQRVRVRLDAVPQSAEAPFAAADDVADAETATVATGMPSDSWTGATRVPDGDATLARQTDASTDATRFSSDSETFAVGMAEEDETMTVDDDGQTKELKTRAASYEEIIAMKESLAKRNKWRRTGVAMVFAVFAAFLGAVWFMTRLTRETDRMSVPKLSNGELDLKKWTYRDAEGRPLLYVDYPGNENLRFEVLPGSNGVQVLSYMGRDRDVPFFLQFEAVERPGELLVGLDESLRQWKARSEQAGLQCAFDERDFADVKTRFFEDSYPTSCENPSNLSGVRFARLEYKRPWPNDELYHGVLLYFRRGSTVFTLRREIPDSQWTRGGRQMIDEPNIAVFRNFSDSYWESPGADGLPLGETPERLLEAVNATLARERASEWRTVDGKTALDALLVKVWDANPRMRELALGKLRHFRAVLDRFYYGKYNAFQVAKDVGDTDRMAAIRRDCLQVFDDRSERYWWKVSGGEEW